MNTLTGLLPRRDDYRGFTRTWRADVVAGVTVGVVVSHKDGSSVIYDLRDPAIAELLAVAKRFLRSSLTETRSLLADLGR